MAHVVTLPCFPLWPHLVPIPFTYRTGPPTEMDLSTPGRGQASCLPALAHTDTSLKVEVSIPHCHIRGPFFRKDTVGLLICPI